MSEIDVSKCIYKKDNDYCSAISTNVFSFNCSEFNNCYYKQLQKLKQENEYLKKCAETIATIKLSNYYETKIDKITLDYEQDLKQYKKSKQTSYEKLQDRCNKLEWENRELKQKLEKIKDICKPLLEVTTIDRLFGAEHTAEYYLAQDILQIIGE